MIIGGMDPLRTVGLIILATALWGLSAVWGSQMHFLWRGMGLCLSLANLYIGLRFVFSRAVFWRW